MKKSIALLLTLLMLVLSGTALAVVKPGEDFYYLDTANVLSKETEGIIYFCNQELEKQCGGQIVIAALDSIGRSDTYDYAYDLFNEWGIGSADENNGFLLLMAIEEDDYYALTGGGIDRVFSSSVIGELNDEYLEPDFAAKRYDQGALKYFSEVLDAYSDYYNLDIDIEDGRRAYEAFVEEGGRLSGSSAAVQTQKTGKSNASYYPERYTNSVENAATSVFAAAVIIILIIVIAIVVAGRRTARGGGTVIVRTPRPFYHHPMPGPGPHVGPRPGPMPRTFTRMPTVTRRSFGTGAGRTGSGMRSSGFGGSRSSSFGSSRSSSFGGSRGGGGRSFGGGGGRGRR